MMEKISKNSDSCQCSSVPDMTCLKCSRKKPPPPPPTSTDDFSAPGSHATKKLPVDDHNMKKNSMKSDDIQTTYPSAVKGSLIRNSCCMKNEETIRYLMKEIDLLRGTIADKNTIIQDKSLIIEFLKSGREFFKPRSSLVNVMNDEDQEEYIDLVTMKENVDENEIKSETDEAYVTFESLRNKIAKSLMEQEMAHKTSKVAMSKTTEMRDKSESMDHKNFMKEHKLKVMEAFKEKKEEMKGMEECLVQALYDFTPQEAGELQFRRGDVITVTDRTDQHWWHGEIGHRRGLFPATYVTPYHS